MSEEAAPLFEDDAVVAPAGGAAAWIRAADGVRLRTAYWGVGDRGTAVLLQGRTEFIEKYYEPVRRFAELGFASAAIDWRGQGLSDRPLGERRRGFVGDFAEFQRDVDAFLAYLAAVGAPKPWVLVGHSMGGAISARVLMRQDPAQRGDLVAGGAAPPFAIAVLSAPMLGLYGSLSDGPIARALSRFAVAFGMGDWYSAGCDRRNSADLGFPKNVLTSDESRFSAYAGLLSKHEDLALGGPTWAWLSAAILEMARLRPSSTPTLIAIGDDDMVVSMTSAERYVRRLAEGDIMVLPNARHEPFLETDAIQADLWKAIADFLEKHDV